MCSDVKTQLSSIPEAFLELVDIIHRLRAPGGCPWDREQTAESLKPFVIEETYEVIDAIDQGQPGEICEELGDLLLQIVLQAEIAAEQGRFTIEDVVRGISLKLVNRHPHVFGETSVKNTREVLANWEQIKKKEKAGRGLFEGIPKQLPALQRAARTGEKAARVGFDWPDVDGVHDKVKEELAELEEAVASGDSDAVESELGDLLFSVAQWARHLGHHPEEALRSCCARFVRRFGVMEQGLSEAGLSFEDADIEALEQFWRRAKES
ncbi:MAG: nucleoside triphosphate pyrophosphohydrolase [Deltaproteobacteria bacterium]|nr:nucleoside triphosphate pyrophosphohydrolase [Deltaproteobacteria bacterium]